MSDWQIISVDECCSKAPAEDPMRCSCWYEGEACCRCDTRAMTEEELNQHGMTYGVGLVGTETTQPQR